MSGEKRAASASFGSAQLVKRQKSDANLNGGALTKTNGSGGALIHGVSDTVGAHGLLVELKRDTKGNTG